MSSGITVSSGLQQVPCSELFVGNAAVILKLFAYINFCVSVCLSFCHVSVLHNFKELVNVFCLLCGLCVY